jgi:hypothetical protein
VSTPLPSGIKLIELPLSEEGGQASIDDVTLLGPDSRVSDASRSENTVKSVTSHLDRKIDPNALIPADCSLYQQIVGSLIHLVIGTRPDLALAVGLVSRYNARPSKAHLLAAQRILHYVRKTSGMQLKFGGRPAGEDILQGYSDADWGSDHDERRSTTGYLFQLFGGTISWSSKRQPTVALSSTEAEYMAATFATQEAMWLRSFLEQLGFKQDTTVIYEDNQSCIALTNNPVAHARSKHIDIRYHFVRERKADGSINLVYIPTGDMVADTLTKPLPKPQFWKFIELMNMENPEVTSVTLLSSD